MRSTTVNGKNAVIAKKIRARNGGDRGKKLARLVEAAEKDVPAGVALVEFRELTPKERAHAKSLEPQARKLLREHG
jgi:hypothetical protein